MVTVSLELWQAGTTPWGQRSLQSSQDKPVGRDGLRMALMTSHGNDSRGVEPLRGTLPTPHSILGKGVITTVPRFHW